MLLNEGMRAMLTWSKVSTRRHTMMTRAHRKSPLGGISYKPAIYTFSRAFSAITLNEK